MEEFLGPHPDYDEEEEERKYYRRKRLGVVKNVVGASVAGMIVYSVYMGEHVGCTFFFHCWHRCFIQLEAKQFVFLSVYRL